MVKPPFAPHLAVRVGNVEITTERGAVSFEAELVPNSPFAPSATLEVLDLDLQIEKEILRDGIETPVEAVYGWKDTDGVIVAGTWKGRVGRATSVMEGSVVRLTIEGLSDGVPQMASKDRQIRRKGEVSSIIQQMAQEEGLLADVDEVGVEIDRLQVNMNNYDFIRKVILPYVNARSSDDPFSFWIANGTLFFKRARTKQHKFVYGIYTEDEFANVLSLETEVNLMVGILAGEEIEVVKIDPNTKQLVAQKAGNSANSKRTVLGNKKPAVGSKRKRVLPHGLDSESAVGAVKNIYGRLADFPLSVNMTIFGNTEIVPMDIIEVVVYAYTTQGYKIRPVSGKYMVMNVKQRVDAEGFFTELRCIKNATSEGLQTAKGVRVV